MRGGVVELAAAKAAGAATINYGLFLQTVVDFLVAAFAIFMIVRQSNRMKRPGGPGDAGNAAVPVLPLADRPRGIAVPALYLGAGKGHGVERVFSTISP